MKIRFIIVCVSILCVFYACGSNDSVAQKEAPQENRNNEISEEAQRLFLSNCAACHQANKDALGPALAGSLSRVPSRDWLIKWIKNATQMITQQDAYAVKIYEKWNKSNMPAFPNLSDDELNVLIDAYCK
jgi:mono/diheme cytochrome c family protein